jgi:CRP/FNR family transcriptional regulator
MKCFDLLNNTELANILSNGEKDLIINNSTVITYDKGDSIVKEREFITNSLFVCSGYVKIHLEFKRRSLILNVMGPKKFILLGLMISLDSQPFSITAIEESMVCLTDIKLIQKLAASNSGFSNYLLKETNQALVNYVHQNLISLTHNNIHGRLANILIYLSEKVFHSTSFDLLLSRKELSQFCNISRENVIKVLYEFDNDGIISLHGKGIQINSVENLRRIANHG